MADRSSLRCRRCNGSGNCPNGATPIDDCGSFSSWSDVWARETATIERAQRITYATAAVLAVLAAAALLFPKALLS